MDSESTLMYLTEDESSDDEGSFTKRDQKNRYGSLNDLDKLEQFPGEAIARPSYLDLADHPRPPIRDPSSERQHFKSNIQPKNEQETGINWNRPSPRPAISPEPQTEQLSKTVETRAKETTPTGVETRSKAGLVQRLGKSKENKNPEVKVGAAAQYSNAAVEVGAAAQHANADLPPASLREVPDRKARWSCPLEKTDIFTVVIVLSFGSFCIFAIPYLSDQVAENGQRPASTHSHTVQRHNLVSDFTKKLELLQRKFPSQSDRFWRVIRASTKRVMQDEEPVQPAAFLLPMSDNSQATVTCLVNHLADVITESYDSASAVHVNVTDMAESQNAEDIKLHIDATLRDRLGSGSKVSVIHNVEKIPPSAALIFHGYCDNERARFKDAIFFYTVHFPGKTLREDNKLVQEEMMKLWSDYLSSTRFMPVLVRIGRNIAFVRPEPSDILSLACQ